MFKKNNYKLKKGFRKLLQLTDDQFKAQISTDEQRTISFMWSKIVGDNECVTVIRFQKQGYRLGIQVITRETKLGFIHEIVSIAERSCVSNLASIRTGDTILEVNGVNLLLLNYEQLALTLSGLPNNIQFVVWKKEGEGVYEKPDSFDIPYMDDPYNLSADNTWRSTIQIIVQSNATKPHGLEFINSNRKSSSSRCVIKKIGKEGFFFDDRRVCINDAILELNGKDLSSYSDKEMYKEFSGMKQGGFLIAIRKYHSIKCYSNVTSLSGSRISLHALNSKDSLKRTPFVHSTPNLHRQKSISKLSRCNSGKEIKWNNDRQQIEPAHMSEHFYETISVSLDLLDDLRVYLVDVQESGRRCCIMCGFHPDSSLRKKFQFKDQIIKVNDMEASSMSSSEVGLTLKRLVHRKIPVTISVLRKCPVGDRSPNDNLIVESDFLTTESDTQSDVYSGSGRLSSKDYLDGDLLVVTLCKKDNSFGLQIIDENGPTIAGIISGSVAEQSGLVKVADKIIQINGIYVRDKEHHFVLTLMRSCGERIKMELSRKSLEIHIVENQTYFSNQTLTNHSNHCHANQQSVFLPLPPIPNNDLDNNYNSKAG